MDSQISNKNRLDQQIDELIETGQLARAIVEEVEPESLTDNTSAESINQDLSESTTDDTVEKSSVKEFFTKYRKTLGIAALSIGLVAGASVAINQANASAEGPVLSPNQQEQGDINGENGPGYIVDTETTEEETETEAETELTREQKIAALEIPAGLEVEEIANKIADIMTSWANYGADDRMIEEVDELIHANEWESWDAFLQPIVEEAEDIYTEAFYAPKSEWKTGVEEDIAKNVRIHNVTIDKYRATQWNTSDPNITEGYITGYTVLETTEVKNSGTPRSEDEIVLYIHFNQYDNADKVNFQSIPDPTFEQMIWLKEINGTMKVVSIGTTSTDSADISK